MVLKKWGIFNPLFSNYQFSSTFEHKTIFMEAAYFKNIDQIWLLLNNLKTDEKIELATRLLSSIRPIQKPKKEKEGWRKLSGAWKNDGQSAEELIQFLRTNRHTNRKIESFS